jgi:nucleotide-binding universal stress UspA family protein
MATAPTNIRPSLFSAPTGPVTASYRTGPESDSRVLVASDGSIESDTAVRFAVALTHERGAFPEVLTVVDPMPPLAAGLDPIAASAAAEVYLLEPRADRLARIRQQLAAADSECSEWPVDLQLGQPAALIAQEATRRSAWMVIVGLRTHSVLERVFRDETALRVMRRATTPVLAVTPGLTELPRRIVVGVDFSRASLHAALAALPLLASGGTLSLVHVQPKADFAAKEETEGLGVIYVQGVAAAFARLRDELRVPRDIKVETVYLEGDTPEQLLQFAERTGAELVAVGSQRHSTASRMLLGSVTTALARAARCSLLVTPPVRSSGLRGAGR